MGTGCPICNLDDPVARKVPHVRALHDLAARDFRPPDSLAGEGIVYAFTGGLKFWPMTVVAVRLMREIGIATPIQIWCDACGDELDGVDGVTIIDLAAHIREHKPRHIGRFAVKDYAIVHSGFQKVLWLDCDAYLVDDPAPLFAILDGVPFAYWSDFDRNMIQDWRPTGQPAGPIPHQIQGGHILINLATAWKCAMLSRWYSNHADYWWRQYPWHDESGWCVALVYSRTAFRVVEPARWERFGFGCYYRGRQYIIHRVRCKLLAGEGRTARGALHESRVMELFRELVPAPPPEPPAARRARLRNERRDILTGR